MAIRHHDTVVIGAGSGGLTVAVGLGKLGKNPLVITKDIGGECTHTGCVPSKKFLSLARSYLNIADKNQKDIYKNTVFQQIRDIVNSIENEDKKLLTDLNVEVIHGTARFISNNQVEVSCQNEKNRQIVRFKKAVLATGSSPRYISIANFPMEKILTNETVFNLSSIPSKLVIIGGGPIAAELATAFASFGTEVHMFVRSKLLSNDPRPAISMIQKSLEDIGVKIYFGVSKQVYNPSSGILQGLHADGKQVVQVKDPEYVLAAIGRKPNIGLDLFNANIDFSNKGVVVDSKLRTTNVAVYAIGDCTTQPKFTHLAYNNGIFVGKQFILPFGTYSAGPLPAVTFTDPAIASVGETVETDQIKCFEIDLSASDRAKIEGKQNMKAFIYVHMLNGMIKGASIVGDAAEHLINIFTLAIAKKTSVFFFPRFIIPYPTYSNGISSLFGMFLREWAKQIKYQISILVKKNITRIIALIVWGAIVTSLIWYYATLQFDINTLALQLQKLLVSEFGIILFFLAYVLRGLISFSATVLSVLAGSIYGFWGGIILTIFASNASSAVAYYLGRSVFSRNDTKNQTASGLQKYLKENPFEATLIARLTFLPYDLVTYIAGALRIPFVPFIAATAIGSIPGTVAIVSFGAGIQNVLDFQNFQLQPQFIMVGVVIMVVSITISRIIRSRQQRKHFEELKNTYG